MEKQNQAVPFRVRVDVSQRRAGGDAPALASARWRRDSTPSTRRCRRDRPRNSLVDFHTGIGAVDDENDDDYLIDHSIVLYLVGPDGKFLDFFTQATPAEAIAAKIREHRSS